MQKREHFCNRPSIFWHIDFNFCPSKRLSSWVILEVCNTLSFRGLSKHEFLVFVQFEFCSFATRWDFEFCHDSSFGILSQLEFLMFCPQFEVLSFVTMEIFELCKRNFFSSQLFLIKLYLLIIWSPNFFCHTILFLSFRSHFLLSHYFCVVLSSLGKLTFSQSVQTDQQTDRPTDIQLHF